MYARVRKVTLQSAASSVLVGQSASLAGAVQVKDREMKGGGGVLVASRRPSSV